jgi:hypothetical protein
MALPALGGGCASNAGTGALVGGGLGTLAGAAVGSASGHAGTGALIGAAAGGLVGGAAGAAEDAHERREAKAAVQRQMMGLEDVVKLTQSGTNDSIIIDQIRSSGTVFHLSADQIVWLQQNGVHEPVIREMQMTAYARPVRVVEPVMVVEPPPPPVGVGVVIHGGR